MSTAIGRNESCPCGSGKRFKRCCGRPAQISASAAAAQLHASANELFGGGSAEEAIKCYRRALSFAPDNYQIRNNLAVALEARGLAVEAGTQYLKALTLGRNSPDEPALALSYGFFLESTGHYDQALDCYDRAIALTPGFAIACYNKAMLKLLLGDFAEGWRLHEWRWKYKLRPRTFSQPLWDGRQDIVGRSILLHAEQGLGDTIQFCRYVAFVEALGADVIFEAPATLIPLLGSLGTRCRLVANGEPLPPFELHCPLMSLPLALFEQRPSIPACTPYLFADPEKCDSWRTRLGSSVLPRIGVAWSGASAHLNDRRRSLPLVQLEPLLSADFEFHSLQKEIRAADRPTLSQLRSLTRHEDELTDFAESAALISALDLVISVDTSIAHLAGALGKPVWVMLPHAPDWRWRLNRSDSDWYPTATLFRQRDGGDWHGVISDIARSLHERFSIR